ncbi:MAG: PEP-CTERM sorting domain-containing protein [Methylophilaceae bacterium]
MFFYWVNIFGVNMMTMKQVLWAAALSLGVSISANATVVTFDDIGPDYLADGYGGVSGWTSIGQMQNANGDTNWRFWGYEGMISFDNAPVFFQGTLYESYAAPQDEPPITAIELYFHGALVHSIFDPRGPLGVEWLASGYTGLVDKIYFRGGLEGFVIDDLTYEVSNVSPVPQPATWLMFTVGLAMLALARRRKDLLCIS